MFFNSPKYSSSETRRPKNSSPSSLLHRCSKFRPFSCSAAPPIFQESRKSNRGDPSSALTNFQGNGSGTKPTSFRAAASWSCRFLESEEASSRSSFSSSSVSAVDDLSERDVLESKEASSRSSFPSSSVSAAADVSERDVQLGEKCIEILAIYLMAKNHILILPFVIQLDLKLHLECERLKATERAP
jgi:hypothetical protein